MNNKFGLSKDDANGRWLVTHRLIGSHSQAYALYGPKQAVSNCLHWAWQRSKDLGGPDCPHSWTNISQL